MLDRFSVAPAYLLTLLENMQPLMQTLLECGANANLMAPPNVVSPLYYLMRVVCSMSPSLLGATAEQVCTQAFTRRSDEKQQLRRIIRPHRSTTYVDAAYCYRPSSVVCRSVCLSH